MGESDTHNNVKEVLCHEVMPKDVKRELMSPRLVLMVLQVWSPFSFLSGALWPLFGEWIVLKSLKSQRGQDGKLYVATKGLIGGKKENVGSIFSFLMSCILYSFVILNRFSKKIM